jgi:RecJ-like exonuclease
MMETTAGRTGRRRPVEEGDGNAMANPDRPPALQRFLRRLFASPEELDAEDLRRGVVDSGSTQVSDARAGDLVTVTGRLRTVVYTPRTTLPTLEADLYDGSDMVRLVWLGRRQIVGIEPGRSITVRGRIGVRDGRKVVYNPYYELEAR